MPAYWRVERWGPRLETAREQIRVSGGAASRKPLGDSSAGLVRDLELHRPASLFLNHCGSTAHPATGTDVVDFESDEIVASELAVDGQIEHRKVAPAPLQLKAYTDRPDILRLAVTGRSDVRCSTARGLDGKRVARSSSTSPMPTPSASAPDRHRPARKPYK